MSDLQRVGPVFGGTGTAPPFTAGFTGAQRVADAHSRYMQSVLEGRVFVMDSDSVTLAAANTTKGVLGTLKFINGFYNPYNSGRNAVMLWASVSVVSGTPTGPFVYNHFAQGTGVSSVATGTIRNALLSTTGGSAMLAQTGIALAVLPSNTLSAMNQTCVMGGPAAVAAGAGLCGAIDDIAGRIVVPPGTWFGLTQVGASTAVVQSTLMWEEIPTLV